MWIKKVENISMNLNYPELELVHEHFVSNLKRRFGTVEPPRAHVKELYTPYHFCNNVVQEGSRNFDVVQEG